MIILNSVVLPTPFGPDARRRCRSAAGEKLRSSISTRSPKPLVRPLGLDDQAAEPRARRDLDLLEVELAVRVGLGRHLLVPLQPGPALRLARPRARPDPLELVLEPLAPLDVLLALDLEPGRLGLQVGRVVALVGVGVAAVELEDPLRHVVQEVPVVGDRHHGARVLLQVLLQPLHALRVQVVGRLVEQQQVRLGQQQRAQRDPAPLAAGQHADTSASGGGQRSASMACSSWLSRSQASRWSSCSCSLPISVEQLVGVVGRHLLGDLVVLLQQRLGLRDALLDVAEDRLALVQLRLLVEQPDREARASAARRRWTAAPRPAIIRSRVDLPVPLGPTTPIFAPGRKASVTSSRMTLSPCAFRTARIW